MGIFDEILGALGAGPETSPAIPEEEPGGVNQFFRKLTDLTRKANPLTAPASIASAFSTGGFGGEGGVIDEYSPDLEGLDDVIAFAKGGPAGLEDLAREREEADAFRGREESALADVIASTLEPRSNVSVSAEGPGDELGSAIQEMLSGDGVLTLRGDAASVEKAPARGKRGGVSISEKNIGEESKVRDEEEKFARDIKKLGLSAALDGLKVSARNAPPGDMLGVFQAMMQGDLFQTAEEDAGIEAALAEAGIPLDLFDEVGFDGLSEKSQRALKNTETFKRMLSARK